MTEDEARADIALIRRAIEDGRRYAQAGSPDMVVWGVAVALGYVGAYAYRRGWSPAPPGPVWALCIGLPWLYSLRRFLPRRGRGARPARSPMAAALGMLWLGCGIFLTTLGVAAGWTGAIHEGWFAAVVAGVLGIGFFVSARLVNLGWLRWVGVAWWLGELAVFGLRHEAASLPLSAAMMLLLLAGPGLVLLARRGGRPAA